MYIGKIWDKKSPINGVDAKKVIEIHKINVTGEVGLILDENGAVAVLQYDNANPYTTEEIEEKLKSMLKGMNNPDPPEA